MVEKCPFCEKKFSRKYNRDRHIQLVHSDAPLPVNKCLLCGQSFDTFTELQSHQVEAHKPDTDFVKRNSAFNGKAVQYRYHLDQKITKLEHVCTPFIRRKIFRTLRHELMTKKVLKFEVIYIAEMVQRDANNEVAASIDVPFRSYQSFANALMPDLLKRRIYEALLKIISSIEEFMGSGSGWMFGRARAADIQIVSIPTFQPTPDLKLGAAYKML